MSKKESAHDLTWCPKHDTINRNCCGAVEIIGTYEVKEVTNDV